MAEAPPRGIPECIRRRVLAPMQIGGPPMIWGWALQGGNSQTSLPRVMTHLGDEQPLLVGPTHPHPLRTEGSADSQRLTVPQRHA